MTLPDRRPLIRSLPQVDADDWAYCRLCQRWFEGIELEMTKIADPVDPGNKIDLMACQRCRERTV